MKLLVKHPTDPNATTTLGKKDRNGFIEIEAEQVEAARAHGFVVMTPEEWETIDAEQRAIDEAAKRTPQREEVDRPRGLARLLGR